MSRIRLLQRVSHVLSILATDMSLSTCYQALIVVSVSHCCSRRDIAYVSPLPKHRRQEWKTDARKMELLRKYIGNGH